MKSTPKPRLRYANGIWWCAITFRMPNPLFHQERLAIGIHATAEGAYLAWKGAV